MDNGSVNSLPLSVRMTKQHRECFMPQQFIKPVKDLYDASGGVVIANESKHQRATPEVDRKEHFSSFTAFNGIHLHNCNIGIGCNELLKSS